jgi:hypothetical protein
MFLMVKSPLLIRQLMVGLALLALAPVLARAAGLEDADPTKLPELELVLPAAPKNENLVEFYVSAATTNHFFVDAATLLVGGDGIVRYTLVVRTAGGATNTTFEGMRCSTGEYRVFASARADGAWTKARSETWRPIENKPVNRHHAALSGDFFCPDGIAIGSADEARARLRLGNSGSRIN